MAPATRNQRTKLESYAYLWDTILNEPLEGNIRMSVEHMGVKGLDDLLDLDKESMTDFTKTDGEEVTLKLSPLDIKKILRVQAWFAHHEKPTDSTWANLNLIGFNTWKTTSQAADIRASITAPDTSTTAPNTANTPDASVAIQTPAQTNTPPYSTSARTISNEELK